MCYGKLDASKQLGETDQAKIDLSQFDKKFPCKHQMKLLFGCGVYFSFQGMDEHVFFDTNNITHGSFTPNHRCSGHNWYGEETIQDKTHKLSVYKDRVRDRKIV